ncbi:hypothetical protein EIN_087240 [Entamoeba invadens IP1]|uniref:hypothetical protein n=1 Tax=Entamoeba invadens IP1 TaxID=370355 RepID=UPI0002C3E595|nr:hypothetical protein EIN_087240 [Entamoeba invadens IP1]ELP85422.1 hypothetical protein EIN_087240 [Entamoeba invadens IP1]|eukprot:XP_004184768.1 hypothetical protein EIN_087240 [Entamoeba invadens IP1]
MYMYFRRVEVEINALQKAFPLEVTILPHPLTQTNFITLVGTLPIKYLENNYNIPMMVMFPYDYPIKPPFFLTDPSPEMMIVPQHPYAMPDRTITHPLLATWNENSTSLDIMACLQRDFSNLPPLKKRKENLLDIQQQLQQEIQQLKQNPGAVPFRSNDTFNTFAPFNQFNQYTPYRQFPQYPQGLPQMMPPLPQYQQYPPYQPQMQQQYNDYFNPFKRPETFNTGFNPFDKQTVQQKSPMAYKKGSIHQEFSGDSGMVPPPQRSPIDIKEQNGNDLPSAFISAQAKMEEQNVANPANLAELNKLLIEGKISTETFKRLYIEYQRRNHLQK